MRSSLVSPNVVQPDELRPGDPVTVDMDGNIRRFGYETLWGHIYPDGKRCKHGPTGHVERVNPDGTVLFRLIAV